MKILYYCWEFPPVGSGIGVYIKEMSQALMDTGHEVIVVTSKDARLPEMEPFGERGSIHRIYDYGQIGSEAAAHDVLALAESYQVDWIEVADHLGEGAALLLRPRRIPVIVKCHYNDVVPNIRYGQARWWWQRPLIDLACFRDRQRLKRERHSLVLADGLLCITRRMLQEIKNAKIPIPQKLYVLPNPIRELSGWVNNEATEPTLLFVGRIDFGKGIDFLPNVLRAVIERFPNARLEIAGNDGFARGIGSIRKWVEKKFGNLLPHVSFLGHISPNDLDQVYRRAWLVLVPSRWDTFPMAVLEAMARSKAIVASHWGGMPEMLAGTGNIIADPSSPAFADAVLDLLTDGKSRGDAGMSGHEKALQNYSPAIVAKEYVDTITGWL
jgi:glycosyltransferase involved in cell wall biosynthesis